jgi:GBP family porin
MKKLAVGISALCASAVTMAQAPAPAPQGSNVKVYGVADLAVVQYRTSGESKTAMHTGGSGSRIGFLSSEDLGQGWRVNARLEAGVNLDTGTSSSTNGTAGRVFSRQAYIELESKTLGAVRLGRQQGPTYGFFGKFDPMLLPPMDAWGVLTTLGSPAPGSASGTGVSTGFMINPTFRTENTVSYISPKMGGMQGQLSYSLNEGSLIQPKLLEASLDYASGPLLVGALFVQASSTPGSATVRATDSVSEMAIGAKYTSGPVQPYVSYIHRSRTDPSLGTNGAMLNGNSESVKLVGAVIPVSERGNVRLTYGRYSSGSAERDASNYGIAYTHELSRSLMLMAAFTHLSQSGRASWPVFQSPKPNPGESVDGIAAGLTWRF